MNKNYTLKKPYEIEKLVKKKQSVGNRNYAIYFEKSETIKIAISVSKKLGKAHIRNYQKRVVREIIRTNFDKFECLTCLIVVKASSLELDFASKCSELLKLVDKIRGDK